MILNATVHPGPNQTRLLVTEQGDDRLRAVLPSPPLHPRALQTLLEGMAMWCGSPVHAVLVAAGRSGLSHVDDLFGGEAHWPHDLASVRFQIHSPHRPRRLRGPGDFRDLYTVHGSVR